MFDKKPEKKQQPQVKKYESAVKTKDPNSVRVSRKTSKTNLVKKHLFKKKTITSWEAITLYGATRLSAIIFNLRKKGYQIDTIDVAFKDRYGNVNNFAKYILINDDKTKNEQTCQQ